MKVQSQGISVLFVAILLTGCGTESTPKSAVDAGGAASDVSGAADTGATAADTAGADTTPAGDTTTGADAQTGDAGKSTDAGPAPTLTTCPALADCVLEACGKAKFAKGCEKACLADANTVALTSGVPLLSCSTDKCVPTCATSKNPNCLTECITDKCGADFFKCVETTENGTDICGDMFACADGCTAAKTNQFSCVAGCWAKISADAKTAFKAAADCQTKGDDSKCIPLVISCVTGGKSGTDKCIDGLDCGSACSSIKTEGGRIACIGKCAAKVEKSATLALIGAASCIAEFEVGCGATVAACVAPTGSATCASIFTCTQACKDGDDVCSFACMAKGDTKSAGELLEVALGCDADSTSCGAAFLTCMAPDGTAKCAASAKCVSDCPDGKTEATCVQDCILKSSKSSAALLSPVLTCAAAGTTASVECKKALGSCFADQ